MTPDKAKVLSSMDNRQKAIGGVLILVVLVFLWVMFGGGFKSSSPKAPTVNNQSMAANKTMTPDAGGMPSGGMAPQNAPQASNNVPQIVPMSDREAQLMKLQQETQTKYLEAINELQVLKVTKDIAVANKDISAAVLARVTAEKKIVDMLAPPPPPESTNKILSPVQGLGLEGSYGVVSVAELQYRWGAVLSYKNNLYNVHVGDVLPMDGSTVTAIGKEGVILEKDGVKKKVSMVPVI